MAKPVMPVDRTKLECALREAEKDGPLANMNLLWNKTAELYNRIADVQISFSVVMLRVREWNLQVKTLPGKRGRQSMTPEQKEAMAAGRGKKTSRSEKMKKFKTFAMLRLELAADPDTRRFLPVVDAAEKGSMRAAIKLKCLDCACYQPQEVKFCTCEECSLFPHRPYKVKPGEAAAA